MHGEMAENMEMAVAATAGVAALQVMGPEIFRADDWLLFTGTGGLLGLLPGQVTTSRTLPDMRGRR